MGWGAWVTGWQAPGWAMGGPELGLWEVLGQRVLELKVGLELRQRLLEVTP